MSIWSRLRERIAALGGPLYDFFTTRRPPEATEGFAIAVVALGAKMAKADGRVTRDEVVAFREIFRITDDDLPAVGRFFDLARTDTAGFEMYAARIAKMFEKGGDVLETLLDALFHIARADSMLHEAEIAFLRIVADAFGFEEPAFGAILARHSTDGHSSPYVILGVAPDASVQRRFTMRETPSHAAITPIDCAPVAFRTKLRGSQNGAWQRLTRPMTASVGDDLWCCVQLFISP